MYAWEVPFTKLIAYARKMELNIVRKNSYVRGLYMTFLLFTTRMAIFCTMLSIVLLYGSDQLTAAKVFVISAYFNIVAQTMSQMFVRGVAEIAEALVAFGRLQNFLEYEEKDSENRLPLIINDLQNGDLKDEKEKLNGNTDKVQLPPNISVSMKNVTARWIPLTKLEKSHADYAKTKVIGTDESVKIGYENDSWKQATLQNINVNFKKGSLIGIVGHVGSGKSSFLQALLRELPIEFGTISTNGSVSYAAQEPWVFAGTARQNILFGQEMQRERYESVVKACALLKDYEQFSNGDRTVIGERGTSLSGGQKARIK